jgi:hypothetical protein
MAPGSLPQAHSVVPLVQRFGLAAMAGCSPAAATKNNDAKTMLFVSPSVPANRLVRAPFCHSRQTKTLSLRFYDIERCHENSLEVANETGIVIQFGSAHR